MHRKLKVVMHPAGHVEVLLEQMQQADVDGALIIQPGNHKFDHSYVSSVLAKHRNKFVGALLADPTTVRTVKCADIQSTVMRPE